MNKECYCLCHAVKIKYCSNCEHKEGFKNE